MYVYIYIYTYIYIGHQMTSVSSRVPPKIIALEISKVISFCDCLCPAGWPKMWKGAVTEKTHQRKGTKKTTTTWILGILDLGILDFQF